MLSKVKMGGLSTAETFKLTGGAGEVVRHRELERHTRCWECTPQGEFPDFRVPDNFALAPHHRTLDESKLGA
jgi:hypothetical protein